MFGRKARKIKELEQRLSNCRGACRSAWKHQNWLQEKIKHLKTQLAKRPTTEVYDLTCRTFRRVYAEVIQLRKNIDLILRHAVIWMPECEKWLWRDREALTALLEGMEDAEAGRLTDGPDLEAGAKLIEDMEKEDRPISMSQARRLATQTGLSVHECLRKFVRDPMDKIKLKS